MTAFPVLISIPHGGLSIPEELTGLTGLTEAEIFEDSDAYTKEIYNIGTQAISIVSTDIARAFIDVNRAPNDRPPDNPDGVVKSHTCYNRPVYKNSLLLDETIINSLLKRYYVPYHNKIQAAIQRTDIKMAIDCHSMAAQGPHLSPDHGSNRPAFCLSNDYGKSCSMEIINRFANCIRAAFQLSANDVVINKPFSGGFITQNYGLNLLPWIQAEMNRSLYLAKPWFDIESQNMNFERLASLNKKFISSIKLFFSME